MTISEWFTSDKDYNKGLAILATVPGVSPALLGQLKNETRSNFLILKYELKKMENNPIYIKSITKKKLVLKPLSVVPKINNTSIIETSVAKEKTKESIALYPIELHGTYRKRIDDFYEMCSLKMQLNEVDEDANDVALSIILKIEDLQSKIDLADEALNYWKENNRLMPVEPKVDLNKLKPMEIFKKIALLETSISKRKKTLESLSQHLKLHPDDLTKRNLYLRRIEYMQQLVLDLSKLKEISKCL